MNIDTATDYRYIYKYVLYVHFYYLRTYMMKAEKNVLQNVFLNSAKLK